MNEYVITLEDGRRITLRAYSEDDARRQGALWGSLNPADQEVGTYEVKMDDGQTFMVPATSEAAAQEFIASWGPRDRAMADASAPGRTFSGEEAEQGWNGNANFINSATLGFDKIFNASAAALETGFENLTGDGPGYGMGDAFNASREVQNGLQEEWQRENPWGATGTGLLGAAAMPGGRQVGNLVIGGGGRGLLASRALAPTAGRSAVVGGVLGGVTGATNANPGEELEGARRGAAVGAITGGAVPVGAAGATRVVRATGLDQVPAVLNRVTGGRIRALNGDVDRRAIQRLGEAMRIDGLSEDTIRTAMNDAVRRGITPNLLDLIGPNATRTRSLVVGAAQAPGPGMTAGAQYRNEVAGSLQDEAAEQAYRLTPGETRSAAQYRQGLSDTNDELAAVNYAGLYDQPVAVTPDVRRALDRAGPQLRMAEEASAYRFPERAAEIAALQEGAPATVSAGALDRVQRRFGTASRNASRSLENADNDLAADLSARQNALNETLESVEGLGPARAAYRGFSNAEEAVDLGQDALRARPMDYADQLARLDDAISVGREEVGNVLPTARRAAGVGLRDQIVQQVGGAVEGATGPLNRLAGRAQANNARQVMETTYGPEATADFQGGIGTLRDRMATANFMDATRGSPTAGRLTASALEGARPSPWNIALGLIDKVRRGATLTDADREALIRLSTQFGNVPRPNLAPRGVPVSGRVAPALAAQMGAE